MEELDRTTPAAQEDAAADEGGSGDFVIVGTPDEADGRPAEPAAAADGERAREEAQPLRQAGAAQDAARQSFIARDMLRFAEQYPDMSRTELAELEKDRSFRRFCGTRFGREPLARLYGDYQALMGSASDAAMAKAAGRSARSTGGGSAGGAQLSPAQREVLNEWNAAHPEMAMTAKEFLRRG